MRAESSERLYSQIEKLAQLELILIENLAHLGAIYINNRRTFENCKLEATDIIRVHSTPRRYPIQNIDWSKRILLEDDDFIIINKPSGIPTHATVDNWIENCHTQVENYLSQKLYVTHRLDRETSGVLVFAKNKKSLSEFNKALAARSVSKKYEALIEVQTSTPETNTIITHYMSPSPLAPKKVMSAAPVGEEGWQKCELIVEDLKILSDQIVQVKIQLLTGRTHQIRAQMNALGCPVLGDHLYNSKICFSRDDNDQSIALHCSQIEFKISRDNNSKDYAVHCKILWVQ